MRKTRLSRLYIKYTGIAGTWQVDDWILGNYVRML